MTERTRSSIDIPADPASVMGVIADFTAYPEWAGEITAATVLETDPATDRATRVRLRLDSSAIRDEHVLDYRFDGDHAVYWKLVESQLLRALDGSYLLEPAGGGGTHVTYELTVDLKIPMIGLVKRKAEKVIIERALTGLRRRVEQLSDGTTGAEGTEGPAVDR
jgi:ribosome-associated toxin RatA of RatAB toxin-antitoxin module